MIITTGVIFVAIIVGGTAFAVVMLRNAALQRAEENLSNLAAALAEQTQRSLQVVDLVVSVTAADFSGASGVPLAGQTLHERLRERSAALTEIEGIAVLDRDGVLVNHSRAFPPPARSYADRDYFAPHRERRVDGLYVGAPVMGRLVPGWQQTFSRRIENRSGEFLGVVSAAMRIDRFHPSYRALRLGPGGRVILFRTDGVMLNTFPLAEDAITRSYAGDELFSSALKRAGSGVQRRAGFVETDARMIAYQRLRDYPLVVVVSSTERHVLAHWLEGALPLAGMAGGASVLIALAVLVLLRQKQQSASLQREVASSEARVHGIIQSAMDAIITIDERERIVLFNTAAERIFGCQAGEALGGPLYRFIPERFRAAHHGHIKRFGETGTTTRVMGGRLELFGLRADGEEFPIDASISQLTVEAGKFYTVILRDVSRRKIAEEALRHSYEELREMSVVMNQVREAERTRIARELHDELAQWLTAIRMDVSWLASRLPPDQGALRQRTDKMKQLVDTTVAAVRRIAADLRPVMLDDLGLIPSIEHLTLEFSARSNIAVSLDLVAGEVDFHDPLATAVYRMVQEALTNVARHAEATEIQVAVRLDGDALRVRVHDNGRGLPPQPGERKSYGILGIRERAQTLGGRAEIYSPPEGGTIVEIVIPAARFRKMARDAA